MKKETLQNYLFPVKGLGKECEAKGLKPAFMPTICTKEGQMNTYANCKCVDPNTGECKICYPEIKKDAKSRTVIYNALDLKVDSEDQ